jgi:hypothetical protein
MIGEAFRYSQRHVRTERVGIRPAKGVRKVEAPGRWQDYPLLVVPAAISAFRWRVQGGVRSGSNPTGINPKFSHCALPLIEVLCMSRGIRATKPVRFSLRLDPHPCGWPAAALCRTTPSPAPARWLRQATRRQTSACATDRQRSRLSTDNLGLYEFTSLTCKAAVKQKIICNYEIVVVEPCCD